MTSGSPGSGPAGGGHPPAAEAIALGRPGAPSLAGRTTSALGTYVSLMVTRPAVLDAAQEILSEVLAEIDLACSRFRDDSELSAVNRAGGVPVVVSPLFARALEVALRAAEITDGDVDPTCGQTLARLGYDRDFAELAADTSPVAAPAPAAGWHTIGFDAASRTVRVPREVMLDFGATAKALAADLAAETIWARLNCGVLVNLGGDISVAGPAPPGGWTIGVDDGLTAKPSVTIESGGLATSSPSVRAWRRGDQAMHHIIDPATGLPAPVYWAAVSVAGATCVDANIASTASIVRGRPAAQWLADMALPARLVTPAGQVTTTGGWPAS